ncbi:MAG: spermidine/putrescine ABC transporter substrate-binding protein [Candidatus Contendobacter sp.]|nr:spermidine/putrescine ABC transporter substrate-binding protein [Candidatus Contendobacter sp.]
MRNETARVRTIPKSGGWVAVLGALLILTASMTACDKPPPVKELVFYSWAEYVSQAAFDAFEREFGVKVILVTYQSSEEAVENIRADKPYDVVAVDSDYIPALVAERRLAEIDFRHVPNFKNISANFRDLATDPGNRHTVPCNYGTTGLLVRTDLIGNVVTRWADLWDPRYAGRIGLRAQPRELIAFTLLSLGYSLNSESPQELDAALERLLELKRSVVLLPPETESSVPRLLSGELAILHGWPEDYKVAHQANPAIAYLYPQEGTALWVDNYVIPTSSPRKQTAEALINFLLRPEIGAQLVNYSRIATANEAALPLIQPEIRDDPVIFPSIDLLRKSHFYAPLGPEGERLYADVWAQFMAAWP